MNMTMPRKSVIISILLTVFGLVVIAFILRYSGISIKGLKGAFMSFNIRSLIAVIIATFGIIFFLSEKWRTVINALIEIKKEIKGYFCYYSALGLLSNTLVPHIGNYTFKIVSLKGLYNVPPKIGALSVLIEQLFDIVVIIIVTLPSLLFASGMISAVNAILLVVLFGLTALFVSVNRPKAVFAVMLSAYRFLRGFLRRPIQENELKPNLENAVTFDNAIDAKLLLYSYLKYAFTVLKLYLIMAALKMRVTYIDIFLLTTLVQIVVIIGSTPCALGTSEAGWFGALMLLGIGKSDIGNFLVVERVIGTATMVFVTFLYYLNYLFHGQGYKKESCEKGAVL